MSIVNKPASFKPKTYTRRVRLEERLAKGLIIFFAFLTMFFLVWIVSYIMYRGFRYDNQVIQDTVSRESFIVELEDQSGIIFVANSKLRIESLSIEDIRVLFTKRRQEKWGFYTQQNIKSEPFYIKPGSPLYKESMAFFLDGTEEKELPSYIQYSNTYEELLHLVSVTPGGISWVPSQLLDQARDTRGLQIISVQRLAPVVHPSVREIFNDRQVQKLDEDTLERLFKGEITRWTEVGGPDLPVVPLAYTGYSVKMEWGPLVKTYSSYGSYKKALKEIPGSIGLFYLDQAVKENYTLLPVEVRKRGWNLTPAFLFEKPSRSGQWGGISFIIINTLALIVFTLLFSTPVGIAAAVFLTEYAKQGRMVKLLRMGTETLAGIPSIIFGLFGYIFFVQICHFGKGFISSTLSVTLMILPTIIRTTEESLKSVSSTLREGSLAMGASKLQTIFKVVIPAALPGILTGIILAIGRTVGETAVLLHTLGSNMDIVRGPASSARVLSLHLYILFSEALSFDRAFATGAVLILIVLLVNFAASRLVGKMNSLAGRSL